MKIGVIADTHGNIADTALAVRTLVEAGASLIIHLGDCVNDAVEVSQQEGIPIECIAGNNDPHSKFPTEQYFDCEGVGIYAVHGHRQDLSRYMGREELLPSLDYLASRAHEHNAFIVIFGHTHKPCDFTHSGVRFINPGALDHGESKKSCCLIDVTDGKTEVDFLAI